jgi:hypothetical protein
MADAVAAVDRLDARRVVRYRSRLALARRNADEGEHGVDSF